MPSMGHSVNCLVQVNPKEAVQVHLIGAEPIVQVKKQNIQQDHHDRSLSTKQAKSNRARPARQPGNPRPGFQVHGPFFVASAFRPVWPGRCDLSLICIPQSTRALVQGGVSRLRYTDKAQMQRPGHTGRKALATKKIRI